MTSLPKINYSEFCYVTNTNDFEYKAKKCNNYPINTDCATITDPDEQTKCELCKNNKLADKYVQINQGNGKNLLDMKEQYQRSWYQTGNLGVGILFLLGCIYYQK